MIRASFIDPLSLYKLGNPTLVREEIYTMNTLQLLESVWQDLRYGVRLLRRSPLFAAVAIVTLALGTGANTAMFEIANAVWLRTLPVLLLVVRLTGPTFERS